MTEPILTREEVLKFFDGWHCSHPGCKDWVEIPADVLIDRLDALQAAVLKKVCGEPIYQTSWKYPASVWGDVSKDVYDNYQFYRYADRRIVYALTRSKP